MSRKRRTFDIELSVDAIEEPGAPESASERARRGPMASAIAENAEALQARQSAAETIRAENDTLAHEYVALREAGHVVQAVPLDEVHTYMLVRDRMPGEDDELEELVTSITELGLSNPIRLLPRPKGDGFELIQGFRRLKAYRQLLESTGDEVWARIPALIVPGAGDVAGMYRLMVDENVIRKDLSFAEMARAAQHYAGDPSTDTNDVDQAVAELFQSAVYSKRTYIRLFAYLLDQIGSELHYPTEIPRALGVTLAREMKARPEIIDATKDALAKLDAPNVQEELVALRQQLGVGKGDAGVSQTSKPSRAGGPGKTKTTFHIQSRRGQIKCTAGVGRLEIKVDRDFSSIDRAKLERAITSLVDDL